MINVIKSSRLKWAGPYSTHSRMRNAHTLFWLENLKGRDHSKDLGLDREKMLNESWGNMVGRCGLDV